VKGLRLDVELSDGRDRFRLLIAKGGAHNIENRSQIRRSKVFAQLAQMFTNT